MSDYEDRQLKWKLITAILGLVNVEGKSLGAK